MGDIVMFTPVIDKKAWAEDIYKILLEAEKALIVVKKGDEVETGYLNCTSNDKYELLSYAQTDIIREIIGEGIFD